MAGFGVYVNRLHWVDECEVCDGSGIAGDDECPTCLGMAVVPNMEALSVVDGLMTTVDALRKECAENRSAMRRATDWLVAGNRGEAIRILARQLGHVLTIDDNGP